MKSIAFAAATPLRLAITIAALLSFSGTIRELSVVRGATDTNLSVTITGTNQNIVLSWFGSNAIAYQVESSPTLTTWTNSSSVLTGGGAFLFVTNPIAGPSQAFFRVKRLLPPEVISASFEPQTGVLTIVGDDLDNLIVVSRDANDTIRVNNGTIPITGGIPTVANTVLIQLFGAPGHDQLSLDETNGALPKANLFGEAGNDTLTGGSGNDVLNGGSGLDTLLGKGGADSLLGGDDNDTITGGDGDDVAQLGIGNDRFVWNPGDDTDVVEGGDGIDAVEVNGGNGTEQFTTTANGTRVRFDRLNPAPFFLDIGTCEKLVLNANGGDDSFSATGNLAALIQITVDGGTGADTLLGSNGIDLLIGGDDNDFIDGQQGNDVVFLGEGDDTFQWDPGDGSDTIEGQAGTDKLLFNGSAGSEIFEVSANGARVRFTRNLGSIIMDLDDLENLEVNTLGGTDTFIANDLTGTDLTSFSADLAGTLGGSTGDAAVDNVIINGTTADDIITATLPGGDLLVTGLSASILVDGFEAIDPIRIQGLTGDDVIDASAVAAGGPALVLDGGIGHDILLGGADADSLIGGDNDDILFGGPGLDTLDGGLGENLLFQDGPNVTTGIVSVFGDALDNTITISRDAGGNLLSNGVLIPGATIANTALIRVFGQGGKDTITFNEANGALPAGALYGGAGLDILIGGSSADFLFGGSTNDTLLGKGGFDLLFGGTGNDTLTGGDGDDQAFGEADTDLMVWNPGDDTDLNEGGGGIDTVEVNGGNGTEQFTTTANGTRVRFDRLNPAPFALDIGTCEKLVLNANGGDDTFSATGNLAALIQITVDGGAGLDTLLGSNGADLLIGGADNDFIDGQQGNDVVFLGDSDDTFQWDPGDGSDTVEGQAGTDTLLFNGSNGSEIFDVAPNGSRTRFTRNLGNIVMDLDDIETLDLNALGSTDTIIVNDLSATDVAGVNINLASTLGGSTGDAQPDNVIINGTGWNDSVSVIGGAGLVNVLGLSATVTLTGSEAANDRVTINTLAGDDVVDASGLPAGIIALTADGGIDDDVLTGSAGADILLGGAGDDVLIGGPGVDVLDGGTGSNILIQD
jgi:Ca2+-binding RTX toxin-like protein